MKDDGPTDRETIGRPVTRLERGAIVAVAAIATARRCASNRNPVRPCEWLPRSADTRHSLKACDGTSSWRAAVACHRRTAAGRPSSSSIHGHLSATPPALEAVRARLPFAACGQLLVSHQHRFRSVSLRLLCRHGFTLSDCRSLRPGYFPVAPTGLLPGRSDRATSRSLRPAPVELESSLPAFRVQHREPFRLGQLAYEFGRQRQDEYVLVRFSAAELAVSPPLLRW